MQHRFKQLTKETGFGDN